MWRSLSEASSPSVANAIEELYGLYEGELACWFASLYDARVGGFYYSESARDNDRVTFQDKEYDLLPDIESTLQALGFIGSSGIAEGYSDAYREFLPEWMQKRTLEFARSLEDPDGYFYHPQWGKNISVSRRGRDLGSGRAIIGFFGGKPRYTSVADGTSAAESETLIPEHLTSRKKFLSYLEELDIPNKSYHAGNTLIAQFMQIKGAGLVDDCIAYLNSLQHPDTGHWHNVTDYYAISGLMKISCVYKNASVMLPNSKAAALGAIDAIVSEAEPTTGITQIWNTWYAARNIISTLRLFGAEGNTLADSIAAHLRSVSAEAILKTMKKTAPFKKSGSSFSYGLDWPCIVSQGSPVCIPHMPEGDVNATVMASNLMVDIIYSALELTDVQVPLFGKKEGDMFLNVLEEQRKKANIN